MKTFFGFVLTAAAIGLTCSFDWRLGVASICAGWAQAFFA